MRKDIYRIVRQLDYTLSDNEIEIIAESSLEEIKQSRYDFATYTKKTFTQVNKKRQIYNFKKMTVENILCHYLKKQMDQVFKIRYASRGKIINSLFNTLPVIKDLNDFVIIRADFKSFFDSVLTNHVYEKYIKRSLLSRNDKEILKNYIEQFKYCHAGLCLSNGMAEIVCQDFDKHIIARLEKYGIVFYERYVDDILVILNSYISQISFLQLVDDVIQEVFANCPVKLNQSNDKFTYISRRSLQAFQEFDFLGYKYNIRYSNDKIKFTFGITQKKRNKYKNIIEQAFIAFKRDRNEELFRQRLKIYSARVVIARGLGENKLEWLTKGVVANYNELRYHIDELDSQTEDFFKKTYIQLLNKHRINCPHFLKNSDCEESIYNMYSTLRRNRSIVFEKNIGVKRKDLLNWIKKIQLGYLDANKSYYRIVVEYLELLKIE
ncbi:hypothetical protein SDC9_03987 [bioreactor metagenome]|uniref:Reverse transcriptase domain-containing protein n=1 Tax=bioreactor metagenome TaxID=1076179 RepID=A0A644SV05_9ZZZZ|nr:hypothetical protein [Negativicutes bacterium]MEA4830865.1 hypothetical protein [Enterococcus thailandicus]